ncbi:MAG: DUF58 domain-containing protein [Deltaproteobacteria bacterium]|nr:DUF58 domain-containing protein [Deltaproteobacteria bacterium]
MKRDGQVFEKSGRRYKWLHIFSRSLSFTREGKIYIVVTLGVGFAAVNTGNNLLFLVLGLMLGLIIVSGILSEVTLRRIDVRRRVAKRVEAGVPFAVELALRNKKRFASSFGVELRDEIDGAPFRRRCFFLRVGKNEERAVAYRCELTKRGRTSVGGTIVSTRFPFGFFEKRRFIKLVDEVVVLPARIEVSIPMPLAREGGGTRSAAILGPGQEYRELRDMIPGDDPRRIHWRSTAKLGMPLIMETDADAQGHIEVVLDAAPSGGDTSAFEQVEQNIRAAGTIIRDMIQLGVSVSLVTSPDVALEAHDQNSAMALLTHLALIDPVAAKSNRPPVGRNSAAVLIGPRAKSRGHAYRISFGQEQREHRGIGI